jgi:alpha-L-rhamnosidase
MYGAATSWFYSHLAGINPAEPGFTSVLIRPFFPEGLNSVSGSRYVGNGSILCSWQRLDDNKIEVTVELPESVLGMFENTRNFSDIRELKPGLNRLVVE